MSSKYEDLGLAYSYPNASNGIDKSGLGKTISHIMNMFGDSNRKPVQNIDYASIINDNNGSDYVNRLYTLTSYLDKNKKAIQPDKQQTANNSGLGGSSNNINKLAQAKQQNKPKSSTSGGQGTSWTDSNGVVHTTDVAAGDAQFAKIDKLVQEDALRQDRLRNQNINLMNQPVQNNPTERLYDQNVGILNPFATHDTVSQYSKPIKPKINFNLEDIADAKARGLVLHTGEVDSRGNPIEPYWDYPDQYQNDYISSAPENETYDPITGTYINYS